MWRPTIKISPQVSGSAQRLGTACAAVTTEHSRRGKNPRGGVTASGSRTIIPQRPRSPNTAHERTFRRVLGIDACLDVKGVFGRVWVSGLPPGLWLGVGWGLARGGFVEEPAFQDAKPVTHATETFLGVPRA